uniref:Vesicle-fusing ATPase n=1 Tax=Eutreptiella gymnastica TaxID=73025 RepID=A0A7S1IN75_9EUGL
MFEMARENAPSIIFIDEVDSLCSSRGDGDSDATRRVKTEFLVQMQGVGHDGGEQVLVLAATNIPWGLDAGIRRRFERRIYIPLPDSEARTLMFDLNIGETPASMTDEDFKELGQRTEGYSGSDINVLTRDAIMEPVRTIQLATHFKKISGPDPKDPSRIVDDLLVACSPGDPYAIEMSVDDIMEPEKLCPLPVVKTDFLKALARSRPSVCDGDIKEHIKWTHEFGQEA